MKGSAGTFVEEAKVRRKKRGHVPIPTEGEGIVITRKTTRITVQFVPGARGGMPVAQDDLKFGGTSRSKTAIWGILWRNRGDA